MQRIDRYLPNVKKTKHCLLVTATNLGQEELDQMRQKLAAKGLWCAEKKYDPSKAPQGGIFFLNRKNAEWPPQVVGPLWRMVQWMLTAGYKAVILAYFEFDRVFFLIFPSDFKFAS